jgi:hypothetical protein
MKRLATAIAVAVAIAAPLGAQETVDEAVIAQIKLE